MRSFFAVMGAAAAIVFWVGHPQAGETQLCAQHMTITDERFLVKGDNILIEDILCALEVRDAMCAMEQLNFDRSAVVRDYTTGEEARITVAFYVISSVVKTPQASGLLAFKTREAAEGFAKAEGGAKVLDYNGLLQAGLVR